MSDIPEELKDKLESSGFKIVEEIDVGNLDDVKDERPLLPVSTNVLLEIKQVTPCANTDETYRWLNIRYSLVDGIDVGGVPKFKNMSVWSDNVCYYADPEKYTKDFFTKRNHLIALKFFMKATNTEGRRISDTLLEELYGKRIMGTIRQFQNKFTAKDGTNVERIENNVPSRSLKTVPVESQV